MAESTKIERAVQIVTRTGAHGAFGSGYLVGGPYVLTAAHVVGAAEAIRIRTASGHWYPAQRCPAESRLDVAVLQVADQSFDRLPPAPYGRIDRDSDDEVFGCSVVGFPSFKQLPLQPGQDIPARDSAHLRGDINPKANLTSRELEFRVSVASTPGQMGQLGGEPWGGLSGAVVRARHPHAAEDLVVGIITLRLLPEGLRTIRAVPIADLVDDSELAGLIGIRDVGRFPSLPFVPDKEVSHYWATVADIERRTPLLLDRDDVLAHINQFARGEHPQFTYPYLWLIGDKWSGKTALQSHFAMTAPTDIDCVTYFLGNRSDADSSRFVDVVSDQLALLLDDSRDATRTAAGPVDTYRHRWEQAVKRAERTQRHLLLIVDGLDDDTSVRRDLPSVASLLPRMLSRFTHVLVTTRQSSRIPADVDVSHPLFDAPSYPLSMPSPNVQVRTKAIELRLRLCPLCKLNDEVDSVPRIVEAGYWAGSQQVRTFELSRSLVLPEPETFLARHGFNLWARLLLYSVFGFFTCGIGWIVVFSKWSSNRRRRARAEAVWQQLHYCNRDGIVYWPGTDFYLYPPRLGAFLYASATQAKAPARQATATPVAQPTV